MGDADADVGHGAMEASAHDHNNNGRSGTNYPAPPWPLRASSRMAALSAKPVTVGLATYAEHAPRAAVRVLVQMALSAHSPAEHGHHRDAPRLDNDL